MQASLITSLSTYITLNRKYYVDDHVFSVTPLGAVSSLYSYFDGGYFDSDGAVHYLHTDYRRSVVMTTDSLHRCTQHVGYYPYGLPPRPRPLDHPRPPRRKVPSPQPLHLLRLQPHHLHRPHRHGFLCFI